MAQAGGLASHPAELPAIVSMDNAPQQRASVHNKDPDLISCMAAAVHVSGPTLRPQVITPRAAKSVAGGIMTLMKPWSMRL